MPGTLAPATYRDKVHGCWLGKTIGGTLGGPYEGLKRTHSLTFYDPVPTEPLPNDDLDLQLVWLRMMEDLGGALPHVEDFARYWLRYLAAWPPDEYGFCLRNLERGLRPPISGVYDNRDIDCMGAPIRSEIWACLAPGNPARAACLAMTDALLDHAGGEGMYGEMFWAAVESAAFVVDDPETLIEIGLGVLPLNSHIRRAVEHVLWCHRQNKSLTDVYDRIVGNFAARHRGVYVAHPCLAVPNHAFIVLGWLYGRDFGDRLCRAVNCGHDTDCTGATLGSVLGIVDGAKALPERWCNPIGDTLILDPRTGACGAPATLGELTDRTVALAELLAEHHPGDVGFTGGLSTDLHRTVEVHEALGRLDIHSAIARAGDWEVTLHYFGEPVIHPGQPKTVDIEARHRAGETPAELVIEAPADWQVRREEDNRFHLLAGTVSARQELVVRVGGGQCAAEARFALLGGDEIVGHDIYWGVPRCEVCRCRVGHCQCEQEA